MTAVHLSARARAELKALLRYISDQSGTARADLVLTRIQTSLLTAAAFPGMGRTTGSVGIRRLSVSPWVVSYRARPDGAGITVLRILDGRRDLSDIL